MPAFAARVPGAPPPAQAEGAEERWRLFEAAAHLLFGLAANWAGGLASDRLARRFGHRAGRSGFAFAALTLSALLLYAGVISADRTAAAILDFSVFTALPAEGGRRRDAATAY